MIERLDKRGPEDLRPIVIQRGFVKSALGSCLYTQGKTKVLAVTSLEESVPPFLKGKGEGWLTAEYRLLPYSCDIRVNRDKISGRTLEIQRLIGRSLRACVDLKVLGERTLWIDCDVIQADGGTRTASINAGFISLVECLHTLKKKKMVKRSPLIDFVGAVSVGIWKGKVIVDLNYSEDADAEVDFNIVMTGRGEFVEIQGTAEKEPFSKKVFSKLVEAAEEAIRKIISLERSSLEGIIEL